MQPSDTPGRVVAASLGLSAFAVAIVAGLAADASAPAILTRAIVSMVVCVLIGRVAASAGLRAMAEAAHAHRAANPIEPLDPPAEPPARARAGRADQSSAESGAG